MLLIHCLSLLSTVSALAVTISAPTPSLRLRETSTAPSPTTAPTGVFITTKHVIIPGVTNDHVTIAEKTINIAIPTCIHTITPDKNGYVPPGTCGALYNYYPSFAAAIVACVLFGMLTVAHITQAAMLKKKFCWVVIMGALWETMGFLTRAISTKHQQSSGLELVSSIFVLLAPLWINAFAYMVLARMIHFFLPTRRIFSVPAAVLSFVFVALDIISFIIQLVGGSYAGPMAPVKEQMKGIHIYMGGIGLQQFFIFVFLGLAVQFHLTMARLERMGAAKPGWKRLVWTLYASLTFISIRIFFRLIEFSAGQTSSNPLPFHEYYLYILEALPMFSAILCYNITHPGSILVGPEAELPGLWRMAGKKLCCGRRRRHGMMSGAEDGQELVSKYAVLGDDKERSGSRGS